MLRKIRWTLKSYFKKNCPSCIISPLLWRYKVQMSAHIVKKRVNWQYDMKPLGRVLHKAEQWQCNHTNKVAFRHDRWFVHKIPIEKSQSTILLYFEILSLPATCSPDNYSGSNRQWRGICCMTCFFSPILVLQITYRRNKLISYRTVMLLVFTSSNSKQLYSVVSHLQG